MKHWFIGGFAVAFTATLFIGVLGWTIMTLWNWLIPSVFPQAVSITFWQAIGLFTLARILMGGINGHFWQSISGKSCHHCGALNEKQEKLHWKQKMKIKWENMNHKEQEAFKTHIDRCCQNKIIDNDLEKNV